MHPKPESQALDLAADTTLKFKHPCLHWLFVPQDPVRQDKPNKAHKQLGLEGGNNAHVWDLGPRRRPPGKTPSLRFTYSPMPRNLGIILFFFPHRPWGASGSGLRLDGDSCVAWGITEKRAEVGKQLTMYNTTNATCHNSN